jgi:putative flippase GtrA
MANFAFARFLVTGAINTVLGYVIYLGLLLILDYRMAYTATYVLGIVFSYIVTSKFVFKTPLSLFKALKFPIVYLLQYVVGIFAVEIYVEILGGSQYIAPLLTVAINVPITFLASRYILQNKRAE